MSGGGSPVSGGGSPMSGPTSPDDRDLRALFEAARREDALRAPRFHHAWARAVARRPAASRRRVLSLALAGGSRGARHRARARDWSRPAHRQQASLAAPATDAVVTITTWTASTDVLLETPGLQVLSDVPRFGELPELSETKASATAAPPHGG